MPKYIYRDIFLRVDYYYPEGFDEADEIIVFGSGTGHIGLNIRK